MFPAIMKTFGVEAVSSAIFFYSYLRQHRPRQIVMAVLMLAVAAAFVAWYWNLPPSHGP